jgi:hypothetical protein
MPEAPRRRAAARESRRPAPRPTRKPDRRDESSAGNATPVRRLVASAREQLEEVIGRPVSGVLGFEPDDNGWQITLEVVELERIPETTSILGCYRARLDRDGELIEYRRIRRYNRSQPDEDY